MKNLKNQIMFWAAVMFVLIYFRMPAYGAEINAATTKQSTEDVTTTQTGNGTIKVEKTKISKLIFIKNSMKIYWSKAKNATGYNVLKSSTKNGKYDVIARDIRSCYYCDKNVKSGIKYYYKIQSVNTKSDSTVCSGSKKCRTLNKPDINLKTDKGVHYISWKKSSTADGYEIRISSARKGSYSVLKEVTSNKYQSYNLIKKGKKYYKVVPYYNVNGKRIYGQPYNTKKVNITKVQLPVKYICQYPNLPTGCEATALTMALNYHGFYVSKETVAGNYMPKVSVPGDFYNNFLGNPFSSSGLGIYAPGLAKTANNYLAGQNTKLRAYNITGVSVSKICKYVATGHPVCIWTTYDLNTNPKVTSTWTIKGKTYYWKSNEHCMTVIGYNKKKDTLIIANPASGIKEYSKSLIKKRNKQYSRMAVVIK